MESDEVKCPNIHIVNRESLAARIFFWFTLFIVIIFFSFTSFFTFYQRKTMKNDLISEGEQLTRLLAYNSRLGVFAENKDLLRDPIEGIMQDDEVVLVQVFTVDGRELKKMVRLEGDKSHNPPGVQFRDIINRINILNESETISYFEDKNIIEFWAAVVSSGGYSEEEALYFKENTSQNKDKVIGYVRVMFTTELLNQNLKTILLNGIVLALLLIAIGWTVVYLIARGVTKPLNRLTEGVKAMEREGFARKVSVETKDEIGKLAQAFNNMAESLDEREEEKRQLEEQLRHAQRMEAIGTLAGGVAHEFNNILSVIISSADLLKKKVDLEDLTKRYLDQMVTSARRGGVLTRSLLTFSRKQEIHPCPLNLNAVIKNAEEILGRFLHESIEFRIKTTKDDLTVFADAGHLEMILMNLMKNANDAMPDGGSLTITTGSVERKEPFVTSHGHGKPGHYAVLTVSDTGAGIDTSLKERLFDPFFTTKEVGKGTGLGLAIVYGIIQQHDGYIDISSEPGNGTVFNIYFPICQSAIAEGGSNKLPDVAGGTETVLIAEDNDDVRRLAASLLEQYGYKVIQAGDGNEAVKKFHDNKDLVKLLLLDVIMPNKDGRKAYEEIKKVRSDIKTIFMSGYTADVANVKGKAEEEVFILIKPVLPDELLRKMREMLDG